MRHIHPLNLVHVGQCHLSVLESGHIHRQMLRDETVADTRKVHIVEAHTPKVGGRRRGLEVRLAKYRKWIGARRKYRTFYQFLHLRVTGRYAKRNTLHSRYRSLKCRCHCGRRDKGILLHVWGHEAILHEWRLQCCVVFVGIFGCDCIFCLG